jgi:prepilin-type N-terminal cleavage/methylation domain-containing protein
MLNFKQQGQTLIEVLIATVVVGTVLTAVAAGLSMSIKNTAQSKMRSLATGYAQQAIEIFQRERNFLGWDTFLSALSSDVYCLNDLPADSVAFKSLTAGACASGDTIGTTSFQREVNVTVGANSLTVVSTVTWYDADKQKQVQIEQTFKDIR